VTTVLPRWDFSDLHESVNARTFVDDVEGLTADIGRLEAAFDAHGVRATPPRPVEPSDATAADLVIAGWNDVSARHQVLNACAHATLTTDSRDECAVAAASEVEAAGARLRPLLARLADWVDGLGVDDLAAVSDQAREHHGPLLRLAERAAHQMSEAEEGLHAELTPTGSGAWARLHAAVTSQLTAPVAFPDGSAPRLPMPAVRGLASHADPAVRRAAYDTEVVAWRDVAVVCAAAMNAIKGEAVVVDRRRRWESPVDASLFANSVSRPTFDAMQAAVDGALDDFRRWMRAKARLHGHADALPWWDLVAPSPVGAPDVSWSSGIDTVRDAFGRYDGRLAGLVDRALDERWIDAEPRDGKRGGAFCMAVAGDRSLVLVNWTGGTDSMRTVAHELGHAFHNTTLAARTPLQRRLPMALAETASIFCETLVVDASLRNASGATRLAMLDADLRAASQVVVDIRSRFLFEQAVFERRRRRALGVSELDDLMLAAQDAAYGGGLDQATALAAMWVVKPHYYGSQFYNWPYTYGLLFGLGLFSRFRDDPDRFRDGYEDLLSRAGMDSAEELGAGFGLDVTDEGFWQASVDVLRDRIDEYERLVETVRVAS
jgi:pepF/M3 family oligoendopeptidase